MLILRLTRTSSRVLLLPINGVGVDNIELPVDNLRAVQERQGARHLHAEYYAGGVAEKGYGDTGR